MRKYLPFVTPREPSITPTIRPATATDLPRVGRLGALLVETHHAFDAIEGYDYMSLRGPAGVLHDIIVDPGSRSRGVGRLLLQGTLTALKARGVPRVVLSTAERNGPAERLFASMGFRRTMIEMTREMDVPQA